VGRFDRLPCNHWPIRALSLTPDASPRNAGQGDPTSKPGTPMTYEITSDAGRCEAMTISEIQAYRCTSVATADRDGHAVCAAHSRTLRIRFYDEDDAGVLLG
jgi:hypothetical protein